MRAVLFAFNADHWRIELSPSVLTLYLPSSSIGVCKFFYGNFDWINENSTFRNFSVETSGVRLLRLESICNSVRIMLNSFL